MADEPQAEQARYDFEISPDVDAGTTHGRVIELVGRDRRVLELGPATGYMTRALRDRGCTVVAIELDEAMATRAEPFCERMIVGDLDELDIERELVGERFDVIVAADVLEHLSDPLSVLNRLRPFLDEEHGSVVVSLPNVAHGSVRLALLEGRFPYQEIGLLDRTHLHFFTRESITELFDEAEMAIVEMYRQELNLEESEVPFDVQAVPPGLFDALQHDPEARTYQFVVKAIPLAIPGMRALQERLVQMALATTAAQQDLADLRRFDIAQLQERESQLRTSLVDAHDQLLRRDEQIGHMLTQFDDLKQENAELGDEITKLRVRLDRILNSAPVRAFEQAKRLPGVRWVVARRTAGYEAALHRARAGA